MGHNWHSRFGPQTRASYAYPAVGTTNLPSEQPPRDRRGRYHFQCLTHVPVQQNHSPFLRQKLQRDVAVQLEVFGFIDHTHPAATELRKDAIVRNGLADHFACVSRRSRTSSKKDHVNGSGAVKLLSSLTCSQGRPSPIW
jgi:hypothetical protein